MAEDTLPFVIEQTGGRKLKVTLSDHDAPMGSPRKQAMFRVGVRNERNLIHLDGRPTPIIHTKFGVWHPAQIKGHLRDHFTGDDGHGGRTSDTLQDIFDDQAEVKLTCGTWEWTAFPENCDIDVEGPNDFVYDLRFDVLRRPGYKPPARDDEKIMPFVVDEVAEAQALLAEQRATLLAQQIAVSIEVALVTGLDSIETTMDECRDLATSFENAPAKADAEAKALSAKAQQVKDDCDAVYELLSGVTPEQALSADDAAAIASFQAEQFAMMNQLDDTKTKMRALQYTANKRIDAAAK